MVITVEKLKTLTLDLWPEKRTVGIVKAPVQFNAVFPLLDRLNAGMKTRLRCISPRLAERMLTGFVEKPLLCSFFNGDCAFPTNALVANEAPWKRLGKEIVFGTGPRFILPTHEYCGECDIALVAAPLAPYMFVADGKDIIVDVEPARIRPILRFPPESGWGVTRDLDTAIPTGALESSPSETGVRYLSRVFNGPYIGPIVRRIGPHGHGVDEILLSNRTSETYSVVVEVPDADLRVLQATSPVHPQKALEVD